MIEGIDAAILDQMVNLGFASKDVEGYALTDEGDEWLKGWILEQLANFKAEIQLPLDGIEGRWIVAIDGDVFYEDEP